MTNCGHDINEREVAVTADGMCPLCMTAEIERLRAAIRWALGDEPDANGKWFGETYDEERARYGWRRNLRKIAGFDVLIYDKEKRTIRSDIEQETRR